MNTGRPLASSTRNLRIGVLSFLQRNPFLLPAVALTTGIFAQHASGIHAAYWFLGCCVGLGAWAVCREHPASAGMLTASCFMLGGLLLAAAGGDGSLLGKELKRHPSGILVRVRGYVGEPPVRGKDGRLRYLFVTEAIREEATGRWHGTRVRLQVVQSRAPAVRHGERLELTGLLTGAPRRYGAWMRRRGTAGMLYVKGPEGIRRRGWRFFPLAAPVAAVRNHLMHRLEEIYPPAEAAMLKALLAGERSSLGREEKKAFAASGTMHLLAISGLHVGLVGGMVWLLLKTAGAPYNTSLLGVTASMLGYMLLAGGRPPVTRATVMGVFFCIGRLLDRRASILNITAGACFFLALLRPFSPLGAGFQLSFAATAAIALLVDGRLPEQLTPSFLRDREDLPARAVRWLLAGMEVSLVAFLATAPLCATYFRLLAPVSIVLSPILIPLLGLVIACGAASLLLPFPFVALTRWGLLAMLRQVEAVSTLPLNFRVDGVPLAAAYYATLFCMLVSPMSPRSRAVGMGLLLCWSVSGALVS